MKTIVVLAAVLMGVSAASVVKANDGIVIENFVTSDLTVKAMDGLKFKIYASNLEKKSVLTIKDLSGNILHKEYCTETAIAKIFDLSTLPDGKYVFELESGSDVISKPFEIATSVKRAAVSLSK